MAISALHKLLLSADGSGGSNYAHSALGGFVSSGDYSLPTWTNPGWPGQSIDNNVFGSVLDVILPVGRRIATPQPPRTQPRTVIPPVAISNPRPAALPAPAQSGSSTKSAPRPYYGPNGEIVSVAEQNAANEPPVDFGQPAPTWGEFPKPEIIEAPPAQESEVATDWGQILSGAVDIFQGQTVGGGGGSFVPMGPGGFASPPGGSETVTVNTRTGKVTPCRRRRRRRLLTPTDLSDLAALSTIVGKGDALKLAVTKAVRR